MVVLIPVVVLILVVVLITAAPRRAFARVVVRGLNQNLIWARTRHTNALRSALREYYPGALEAFDNLADRDALAVLGRAPTPAEAARLSLAKIRSALKSAGRQRNLDTRVQEIAAVLRTEQLAAPAAITAAFAATTRAAVSIIGELNRQISDLEAELATHSRHTRTPTSTSPCQDSVSSSAPGCSVSSGTTPTATPPPSVAKTTPEHHP